MTSKVVIHTAGEGKVLPMGIRFLSTGENSAHTSMFELTLSAGSSTGLHVHRVHEETFYVLEGECEWQIGAKQVHAKPGAFVFIPPSVLHNISNSGDKPVRCFSPHPHPASKIISLNCLPCLRTVASRMSTRSRS